MPVQEVRQGGTAAAPGPQLSQLQVKRKPRRAASAGAFTVSKVSKAISSDYVTILSYNGIYGPIERGIIYRVFV